MGAMNTCNRACTIIPSLSIEKPAAYCPAIILSSGPFLHPRQVFFRKCTRSSFAIGCLCHCCHHHSPEEVQCFQYLLSHFSSVTHQIQVPGCTAFHFLRIPALRGIDRILTGVEIGHRGGNILMDSLPERVLRAVNR
jgi:hypothetical protein